MLISSHQEYFKFVTAYNRSAAAMRPKLLAGMVLTASRTHPDPLTRSLLSKFYAQEAIRNAPKPQHSG